MEFVDAERERLIAEADAAFAELRVLLATPDQKNDGELAAGGVAEDGRRRAAVTRFIKLLRELRSLDRARSREA
jgi:hypothetical protein